MQLIADGVTFPLKYFPDNVFKIWLTESIIALLFVVSKLDVSAEIYDIKISARPFKIQSKTF